MSKKRLFNTLAVLILVGGVFGAAIIFLMRFVDGPVAGKVTTLADAKHSAAPTPVVPQHLYGLYMSFAYPAGLDQVGQSKTDATALEQYSIGAQNDYRQSIQVHVAPLIGGNMMEDSSFRLRNNDTTNYKATTTTVGADKMVLMVKANGSEQTLFASHGAMLLTIAVTSTSTKATAAEIMAVIKPTVAWKAR